MAAVVIRRGSEEELAATGWQDAAMWVAEVGTERAGHAVARQVAVEPDEWELLIIETGPAFRRQGVAETVLRGMLEQRPGTWFLEVRASNAAAIALYEKVGFREAGRRRDYYPVWPGTGREEGIVFTLRTC